MVEIHAITYSHLVNLTGHDVITDRHYEQLYYAATDGYTKEIEQEIPIHLKEHDFRLALRGCLQARVSLSRKYDIDWGFDFMQWDEYLMKDPEKYGQSLSLMPEPAFHSTQQKMLEDLRHFLFSVKDNDEVKILHREAEKCWNSDDPWLAMIRNT